MAVVATCEHCGDAQPHEGGEGCCECECHVAIELAAKVRRVREFLDVVGTHSGNKVSAAWVHTQLYKAVNG